MSGYDGLRDMCNDMYNKPHVLTRAQIATVVKGVAPLWAEKWIERVQKHHDDDDSSWFYAKYTFPPGGEHSTMDQEQEQAQVAVTSEQDSAMSISTKSTGDKDVDKETRRGEMWAEMGYYAQ